MAAGKNYNIQTRVVGVGSTVQAAKAIGSSVAAGKTRYVTFIAITPRKATNAGRRIYFCSTSTSVKASTPTLASAAAKLRYNQISASAEQNAHFPDEINTENPLFTIAASKFLTVFQGTAQAGSGATSVFVQYYDQ